MSKPKDRIISWETFERNLLCTYCEQLGVCSRCNKNPDNCILWKSLPLVSDTESVPSEHDDELIQKLSGTWDVKSVGFIDMLELLNDKKVIKGTQGFNYLNGDKWGFFKVKPSGAHPDELLLIYDVEGNSPNVRRVVDIIRPHGDGWRGTLYYMGRAILTFQLTPTDLGNHDG